MKKNAQRLANIHLYEILWVGVWILFWIWILIGMNLPIQAQGMDEKTVWQTVFGVF